MKTIKNCEVKGLTKNGQALVESIKRMRNAGREVKRWNYLEYVTEYGKMARKVS